MIELPIKEQIDNFFHEYTPKFLDIFDGNRDYELYWIGSSRDRILGYTQVFTPENSCDVDLILTTPSQPDTQKLAEAMTTAVKLGEKYKLLIDICSMEKPYYYEYENFMEHDINHRPELYLLHPIVKMKLFKITKTPSGECPKLLNKIKKGWILFTPSPIIKAHPVRNPVV